MTDKISPDIDLLFGVLQGSVSGPKNYCMYIKPVGKIIKQYNIKYHCYADDTQVYMTLKAWYKWDDMSSSIEACIADISTSPGLIMNKSEFTLTESLSGEVRYWAIQLTLIYHNTMNQQL